MKLYLSLIFILVFSFTSFAQNATVISENANLRGTPSQYGKVVETLESGSAIQVIQQKGVWFLVQTSDYVGWMHGDTIKYIASTKKPLLRPTVVKTLPKTKPQIVPVQTRIPASSRGYIRGPRGGCYYYTASGRKQYVDRSLCN